jgi:hypothetical protein
LISKTQIEYVNATRFSNQRSAYPKGRKTVDLLQLDDEPGKCMETNESSKTGEEGGESGEGGKTDEEEREGEGGNEGATGA